MVSKPSFTENSNTGVKNNGFQGNNRPQQKPIASTIYKEQPSPQNIDSEVSD